MQQSCPLWGFVIHMSWSQLFMFYFSETKCSLLDLSIYHNSHPTAISVRQPLHKALAHLQFPAYKVRLDHCLMWSLCVCVCVWVHVCVCTITSAQGTHPPAVPHLQGKNWPLFDLISVCVCVCVINMWCINMYKSLSVYEQVCMCGWTKLTIGVHGVLVECTRLCWSFIPVERIQLLVEAVWDYKTVWIYPQYAHLHALKQ